MNCVYFSFLKLQLFDTNNINLSIILYNLNKKSYLFFVGKQVKAKEGESNDEESKSAKNGSSPPPSVPKCETKELVTATVVPEMKSNGDSEAPSPTEIVPPETISEEIVKAKIVSPQEHTDTQESKDTATEIKVEVDADKSSNQTEKKVESEDSSEIEESCPLKLKYSYKADQWSPLNPSGNKAYDRNFLLNLKQDPLTSQIPKDLPILEVVLNKGGKSFDRTPSTNMGTSDFTPNYMRPQGGHREKGGYSSQAHRGSNSMRGGKKMPKIIDAKPSTGKVTLKTTENAWTVLKSEDADKMDIEQMLCRKLRGILNKICPETYEKLKNEFRDLFVLNEEFMISLVNLVFEKSTCEQHFAGEYAKLCKFVVQKTDTNTRTQLGAQKFRKTLLLKCQTEFEKKHKEETSRQSDIAKSIAVIAKCNNPEEKAELQKLHDDKFFDKNLQDRLSLQKAINAATDAAKAKMLQAELDLLGDNMRRKSVGLIKFVAVLYKEDLLTNKIIMNLFFTLVKDVHRAEQAEILCKLFINIGEKMWNIADDKEKKDVKECIDKIKRHADTEDDSRIRFMLFDVIELFDNRFVAKHRSQKQVGPSTKKEVFNKMQAEALQINRDINQSSHNSNNRQQDRGPYRKNDRGSNSREQHINTENSELWNKVVNNNCGTGKRVQSLQSLKNFGGNSDSSGENQRLGPSSGFGAWSRGASGGGGGGGGGSVGGGFRDSLRNNVTSNDMPSRSNRFAALNSDDVAMPETQVVRRQVASRPLGTMRSNPFKEESPQNRNAHGGDSYQGS